MFRRWWVAGAFAAIAALVVVFATHVPKDNRVELTKAVPGRGTTISRLFETLRGSDNAVPAARTETTDILSALRAYSGDTDINAWQVSVAVSGPEYDLIRISSDDDAAYQVYDKRAKTMNGLPIPYGGYRVDTTDGQSIAVIEAGRVLAFERNSPHVIELDGAALRAEETYYRNPRHQVAVLGRSGDIITVQIYSAFNVIGDGSDNAAPVRTLQIRLP